MLEHQWGHILQKSVLNFYHTWQSPPIIHPSSSSRAANFKSQQVMRLKTKTVRKQITYKLDYTADILASLRFSTF